MPLFLGSHWWPLWVLPLSTAFGLLGIWWWRGRDDRAVLPASHSPLPPLELSPAQVATLIDESCDLRDIVATLVDLAARGYLSIEEAAPEELVLTPNDLRFMRCADGPPTGRLKKHERMFLSALFDPHPPDLERGKRSANSNPSDAPWNETALSLLHNKFYRHLPGLEAEIYDSLMAEGFFFHAPKEVRALFGLVGGVLLLGSAASLAYNNALYWSSGLVSLPLGAMLSGVLWLCCARFMPARTALGTLKADQTRRFVAWVHSVPIPTLRLMLQKDANVFERLLPYALVLEVGEVWARKCGECGQWAPFWFSSSAADAQNAPGAVAHLMAHLPRIERTLASEPPPGKHPRDSRGRIIDTGSF